MGIEIASESLMPTKYKIFCHLTTPPGGQSPGPPLTFRLQTVLPTIQNGMMPLQHKPGIHVGESWGMANDGEWRTGQYLVEGVKVIKCFHPRMLTPPMARVNTN